MLSQPAFKATVALQMICGAKTLAEQVQQPHVHATQIGDWEQQLLERQALIDREAHLLITTQYELMGNS